MLTDFRNSFTGRLIGKFATNSYLNIRPHHKYVTTLPYDIRMSEKKRQSDKCIVTNDKSQDNTAKHLSYDRFVQYKFLIRCPIGLKTFVLKDAELAGYVK